MKTMKIEIEVKPFEQMRYPTLGDYYYLADGTLKFEIAETGNSLYNKMILVHELIEQALTELKGISTEEIDQFDMVFENERRIGVHSSFAEPGFDLRAPYHNEHTLATSVEMMMCAYAGIPWQQYEADLNDI